jgi:hypothetical protein
VDALVAELVSAGQGMASQLVQRVQVDSALLPQIVIDDPLGPSPVATSESSPGFLALLKPKITVYTPAGQFNAAPWGDPGPTSAWPLIEAGLAIGGVLAIYGAMKLLRGGR